jgi:hypothetical protein
MMQSWKKVGIAVAAVALAAAMSAVGLAQAAGDALLTPAETTKLLPDSVWFKGQSATTQKRNSGGVKFADGMYVLATLVDTSGYSSDVQEKYQAYFITEIPIKIEGHDLAAGIYGVGFVAGDMFNVLDVGAHELFTVGSHKDAALKRPMPLKVAAADMGYRLYVGRNYVSFSK